MPVLHAKPQLKTVEAPAGGSLEEELDGMVHTIESLDPGEPDVIMATCMALMARCTEIYLNLVRIEAENRRARVFRTTQLQKVMDLIDFQFRGASRLIEVRRQEVELSK